MNSKKGKKYIDEFYKLGVCVKIKFRKEICHKKKFAKKKLKNPH